MKMDLLIGFLIVYGLITTSCLCGVAVFIISKGNTYAGRFKRNLTYSDNVLTNHLDNLLKVTQAHKKETNLLIKNVTELQKVVGEILNSTYGISIEGQQGITEESLNNKYPENKILRDMGDDHNIKVVGKTKDAEYLVGDFINAECPICKAQLIGNQRGDVWCSNKVCNYMLDSNKQKATYGYIPWSKQNTVMFDGHEAEQLELKNNDINLLHPKITKKTTEDTIERPVPINEYHAKGTIEDAGINADYVQNNYVSLKDMVRKQHKKSGDISFED